MDEIKIEKGIKIPERIGTLRHSRYPYRQLKVGESFFVKDVKGAKLNGSIAYWQRTLNIKLVWRTVDGGVRVWRTR
jgi:hypothetical protein